VAPVHLQIEEELAGRIESGALGVGERLPGERELARRFGVSRMTVRQALGALAGRGLIERGVGRGTFVARPKLEFDGRAVLGFTGQMERAGLEPGAQVLHAAAEPAPAAVAEALALEPGAEVAHVERLRFGDRAALTLEEACFPFPDLAGLGLTGSLYETLRECYAAGPVRATESLEAVPARREEAALLGVPAGTPLMLVVRIAYDAEGRPVEYARDRHRGDRARFVVDVAAGVGAPA